MSPAYSQPLPQVRLVNSQTAILRDFAGMLLTLLVFTIPWEDQFVIQDLGTLSRVVGIAAFGAALLAVLADGQLRIPRPVHLALLAFIVWAGLTCLWSVDLDFSLYILKTWGQLLALLWLILEFASTPTRQVSLLRAYVLGTCVSAVGTLISYSRESSLYWERSVAAGFDPNDLCVILALSIPMSFYLLAVDSRGFRVWLWRLHLPLIFCAALLTASRGGFIAICGSLLIVPLLFRNLTRVTKTGLLLAVVFFATAVMVYAPTAPLERLASIPQEISSGTIGERGAIWRAGWQVYQERPFTGVGIGAFATAVSPFLGEAIVAHNAFLTVLVETGLVGFALLILALCMLAARIVRLDSIDRRFWSVMLLTWFLGAMSLSWAHRKPTWLLFGLIAAAGGSVMSKGISKEGRV